MQTGPNLWEPLKDPVPPVMANVAVPASTSAVTLQVIDGRYDLNGIVGTRAYAGFGTSWTDVQQFNKAGQYFTVE